MSHRSTVAALLLCALVAGGVVLTQPAAGEPQGDSPSLALHMGHLQRYSQKLGLAVAAKNKPLATYYAKTLKEASASMKAAVPTKDGIAVARFTEMMLESQFKRLDKDLAGDDWAAISKRYGSLLQGCNGCHSATKHPFIDITPPSKEALVVFNQSFAK